VGTNRIQRFEAGAKSRIWGGLKPAVGEDYGERLPGCCLVGELVGQHVFFGGRGPLVYEECENREGRKRTGIGAFCDDTQGTTIGSRSCAGRGKQGCTNDIHIWGR